MSTPFRIGFTTVMSLAACSTTLGSYTETIFVGQIEFSSHTTAFSDDALVVVGFIHESNPKPVIGMRVTFTYTEVDPFTGAPALDSSLASDLGLTLDYGGGVTVGIGGSQRHLGAIAGGYTLGDALGAVDHYDIWDFDGIGSDLPDIYTHEFYFSTPLQKPGDIWVRLTDTWDGNTIYSNITFELIKVPSPSAAVLLAMAGLIGRRRKR